MELGEREPAFEGAGEIRDADELQAGVLEAAEGLHGGRGEGEGLAREGRGGGEGGFGGEGRGRGRGEERGELRGESSRRRSEGCPSRRPSSRSWRAGRRSWRAGHLRGGEGLLDRRDEDLLRSADDDAEAAGPDEAIEGAVDVLGSWRRPCMRSGEVPCGRRGLRRRRGLRAGRRAGRGGPWACAEAAGDGMDSRARRASGVSLSLVRRGRRAPADSDGSLDLGEEGGLDAIEEGDSAGGGDGAGTVVKWGAQRKGLARAFDGAHVRPLSYCTAFASSVHSANHVVGVATLMRRSKRLASLNGAPTLS